MPTTRILLGADNVHVVARAERVRAMKRTLCDDGLMRPWAASTRSSYPERVPLGVDGPALRFAHAGAAWDLRLRRIKEMTDATDHGQPLLRFLETVAPNRRHYDVIVAIQ